MLIELKVVMSVLITFAQTRMVTPPFRNLNYNQLRFPNRLQDSIVT